MGITITNRETCVILFLVISIGYGANGLQRCPPDGNSWIPSNFCDDDEYCCGINDDRCCGSTKDMEENLQGLIAFILLILILCCPIYCCYRCCCRSQPGFVYSPAETNTHVVVGQSSPPSQVPYPSTMPYPQQTPYPPQHATNPYYGGPPPPYNVPQGHFQNASAPTF